MIEIGQLLSKTVDTIYSQAMGKLVPIKDVPFWYVRHGQTDWNLENRAMGQTDIPLNAHGEHQAVVARSCLVGEKIATICHSPLSRAKRTAEIFNEVLDCKLVEIEELREFNLGPYEGRIKGDWFQDWKTGMELPQTEFYVNFMNRALVGINKALSFSGPVLIVAHGGVYWAIEQALQVIAKEGIQNCVPVFHKPTINEKWQIQEVFPKGNPFSKGN